MDVHIALQFVDNLVFGFTVGQVLLYTFLMTIPLAFLLDGWTAFGLLTLLFGVLLVSTPSAMLDATTKTTPLALSAPQFRMIGVGMLLLGPLLITVLGR